MADPIYIWRFTPVARPDDPTWQGRGIWSELEIVAQSCGEAVLLACRFEKQQSGMSNSDSQDRQQARMGFEDERLYRVDRTSEEPPADASPGTVTRARRLTSHDPSEFPPRD